MELSKKLKEQGWYLTEDGLKRVASESTDMRKIIAAALDMDFRDIAGGALPTKKEDTLPGRIVLQVQKVHNISAPKANEESKAAPRLLQLELSDGQTTLQALELETVPALSLNVPPGTKIYFRAERLQLMQGFLVLRNSELQVLGGRVEAMAEKWELARAMQQYARAGRRISGTSGPPPWIAFGKKIEALKDTPQDRNFKSLQAAAEKDKEVKENEEFNAMRSEAIAEATKAGAKKVFGGGGQQILDHNVKKILEKGYSEEEAKIALRNTNNNLERALYNLKRRQDYNHSDERQDYKPFSRGAMPREMGGKRGAATAREEADAARPAANVSLFDFLTDKLPANVDAAPSTQVAASNSAYSSATQKYEKTKSDTPKSSYNSASKPVEASSTRPKFENNISSSFAANRGPPRNNRAGDYVERNERNPFNTDRPTNSRYSSRGGGPGNSGGRGGFTAGGSRSVPYEDAGNRNYPPASNVDNERGARYSNTSARGSNRGSHERSAGPQEVTGPSVAANGAYDNKRSNERSRGGAERYGSSNENRNYDKNRYQRDNSSRTYDGNRPQSSNNNSGTPAASGSAPIAPITNNYNMNKLVESTSKLKIDKPREQQPAGGNNRHQQQQSQRQRQSTSTQQQQPQQQQQPPKQYSPNQQPLLTPPPAQYIAAAQQSHGAYSQLPNGYTYDPSKIIGFQSKETNEFAMTLLKSQSVSGAAQQQQQQAPPATIAQPLYLPGASPYGTSAAPAYVLPSPPLPQAPMPNQFGMVSAEGWLWKIGDLCLAKYWDDGRYYEAEITGVSDKTCVVFFLSYGNHEEVLKSDCLPITDVNHCPINSYAQVMPGPPPQQQLSMQANAFQRGGGGGGGPQRYRGERQMYVPPHKREN